MSSVTAPAALPPRRFRIGRHQGVIVAIVVFAVLMGINAVMSNGGLTYFDVSSLATGGAPLKDVVATAHELSPV